MRKALLALEHFPRVPSLDPWVAWPDGARPTNGPGTDLLFAAAAFALGAQGAPDRAARIIAWVPVALGVACALAAAHAASRLEPELRRRPWAALAFAAAIPVAVRVSSVGFTDHHVFESLAPLATLAWVASRGDAPTLRWEAHGALLIASAVGLYPGTLVSHALLAAGLGLLALLADAPAPIDGVHEAEIALRRPGIEVRRGVGAGVLTSWDAGNDALLLGRRPVIETGFGPYIGREVLEASERAWRAPESELVAWLDRRDVGEVLIWGRHVLALGGAQPPLASRVTPDGRTVLNVEYLRRYPIAVAMLAGSGNARFAVPHLSQLRPRFARRQFTGAFAAPLSWAWVFERVRGVRLHGAAPEGMLVRATLPLAIWTQRRVWEGWTRARGGAWSITVPIPTAHREGAVASGEAYTVLFEDRVVGHARASLSDVRAGRDVEVSN